MDEERILNVVSLDKDVDGFHPLNMGNLAMRGREPLFVPCTPRGCIELLLRYGVEIMGKKAVVIGRSNIVGMPTSLLLQVELKPLLLNINIYISERKFKNMINRWQGMIYVNYLFSIT